LRDEDAADERSGGGGSDTPNDDHETRPPGRDRGKTIHGEAANAGHRVLAPDDAEVEAYLETALNAPAPDRTPEDRPGGGVPRGESSASEPDTIVVLDFGSQYAQLIARRVRELHVYSELVPFDMPWEEIARRRPRAVILSGGPASVYAEGAPRPDPALWTAGSRSSASATGFTSWPTSSAVTSCRRRSASTARRSSR
jgi:hypothetical protein